MATSRRALRAFSTRVLDRRAAHEVRGHRAAPSRCSLRSLVGMQFVQQQFFPASDRPELLVDLTLPQGVFDQRDAQGRRRAREDAEDRPRYRALVVLHRQRRHPLLPAARPAARQRLLRASRRRHQGLQGPLRRAAAHPRRAATAGVRAGAVAREPARAWTAGRLAAEVPHQRPRPDESARAGAELRVGARQHAERAQHQLRLERALEGGPRRGGPGPRARARHQLASA